MYSAHVLVASTPVYLCRCARFALYRLCAPLQAVGASFERTLSSLYVNLQSKTLQQYDKAPHLRQLYLRLDFNGFIRRHNTQMVRTVSSSRAAAKQAAAAAAGEHERAVEERRLMQLRSATGP